MSSQDLCSCAVGPGWLLAFEQFEAEGHRDALPVGCQPYLAGSEDRLRVGAVQPRLSPPLANLRTVGMGKGASRVLAGGPL